MAKIKSFQYWHQQEVEQKFGLVKVPILKELKDLLDVQPDSDDAEKKQLENLRVRIDDMINALSEEDLKMYFISQLINIVDFFKREYRMFFDQNLNGEINGETIGGKVDCLLAKGYQIPEQPFFFLQEYKSEIRRATDPLGQLLAAMVVTQTKNQDDFPLFGCYVNGRMWFFVALVGKKYAVSHAYDTTQDDIFIVITVLRKIKRLFEEKIHFANV
jgi:hypothetical protein